MMASRVIIIALSLLVLSMFFRDIQARSASAAQSDEFELIQKRIDIHSSNDVHQVGGNRNTTDCTSVTKKASAQQHQGKTLRSLERSDSEPLKVNSSKLQVHDAPTPEVLKVTTSKLRTESLLKQEPHKHQDGYVDTSPSHPLNPTASDHAGDGKSGGLSALSREAPRTGEMPDHFSVLSLIFGPCNQNACSTWDKSCTCGLVFCALLMAWAFKNLKVISDVYFVPSTIRLAKQLGLPNDVAGATLLAFGSSAPEFCTNIVAAFFIVNECGVGDIIGSAIHNVLLVVGVSAIFATRALNLWWYPLSRDCIFYAAAIVELTLFLWDEYITILEAMVMILTYVAYCAWMIWNNSIYTKVCTWMKMPAEIPEDGDEDDEDSEGIFYYDPVEVLWRVSMPSVEGASWSCFICSLLNIWWLSYVMVDAASRFGCIVGIPTLFMGLVFLAAGTSIPDAFASMAAAKRGEGDMAVSNALGSNIFDILLGLGLPWLIALMSGRPIVFLGVSRLISWVTLLLVVLVAFMGVIVASGWKLNKKMGLCLGGMYIGYIFFALLQSWTA